MHFYSSDCIQHLHLHNTRRAIGPSCGQALPGAHLIPLPAVWVRRGVPPVYTKMVIVICNATFCLNWSTSDYSEYQSQGRQSAISVTGGRGQS